MTTCIILAGGLGTRLRKVLADRPKCLAPVGSRSFLDIQLELLHAQGMESFVLALGFGAKFVLQELEQLSKRFSIRTVIEDKPLGTGGATLRAMGASGLVEAVVTNGDTFLGGNLAGMLARLSVDRAERTRMAVLRVADRSRFGGVSISSGRISSLLEKGESGPGLINAGMYRMHISAFEHLSAVRSFSLEKDLLPLLSVRGELTALPIDGEFIDIGVPADYFRFCNLHQ